MTYHFSLSMPPQKRQEKTRKSQFLALLGKAELVPTPGPRLLGYHPVRRGMGSFSIGLTAPFCLPDPGAECCWLLLLHLLFLQTWPTSLISNLLDPRQQWDFPLPCQGPGVRSMIQSKGRWTLLFIGFPGPNSPPMNPKESFPHSEFTVLKRLGG